MPKPISVYPNEVERAKIEEIRADTLRFVGVELSLSKTLLFCMHHYYQLVVRDADITEAHE